MLNMVLQDARHVEAVVRPECQHAVEEENYEAVGRVVGLENRHGCSLVLLRLEFWSNCLVIIVVNEFLSVLVHCFLNHCRPS